MLCHNAATVCYVSGSMLVCWRDGGLAGWPVGSVWLVHACFAIKTCGRWLPNSDPNLQLPLSEDGNMQTRIPGRPLRGPGRVLRCIITSPTFDCHDRRALHVVLSRARRARSTCACLSVCLSICLSLCLPAPAGKCGAVLEKQPRCVGKVGRKAGRTQVLQAETGKRDPGSWGTTEYPSPRFIQLLSPSSSPPYDAFSPCPSLPPPIAFGGPAMSCMLVMRAKGRGAQKATSQSNQIRSTPLLPSPNSSQLSGLFVLSRQSGKDSLDSA